MPASEHFIDVPGLEIRERIGGGGMGSVYKVYQPALDRVVALKTVRPEYLTGDGLGLFQREARLLARCSHPNIVKVLEFHPEHSVPYLLMEYVDGIPLDQALRERPWAERARLFQEVVATVASAHEHGVVHGDLKPANVLVDRRSKPHVLDFGLARLTWEVSRPGDGGPVGGTPGYLAPEVLEGRALPCLSSDVYALGVMLYVLLTGVLPYQSVEEAQAGKVRLPMEHDTDVPEPLQRICLKAIDRSPGDRYQIAELMQRDLERYCGGKAVLARPAAYLRELEGRVQNHVSDIQLWEQQGFIGRRERDALTRPYGQVLAADSPWLSETRKVLTGPLLLRVGAWLLLLSSLLWPVFYWARLSRPARVASAGVPTFVMAVLGVGYLICGNRRNALACLGSFALLLLVFEVVLLSEFHCLEYLQPPEWELWGEQVHDPARGGEFMLSNSQIFVAALTVTLCVALLLRYLRAAFFAPWLAAACVGLSGAVLLLVGDKERLFNRQVAWVSLHSLGFAAGLYLLGYGLERWANPRLAKPSYLVAVVGSLAAAVTLAGFGTEEWFDETWAYDTEVWNLWLMAYTVPVFLWAWLTERYGTEAQRTLTWLIYLLVPIFALVPLNLLFAEKGPRLFPLGPHPVRLYELLYLLACVALLVEGKLLRIESFLQASLWGFAVWVLRVTFYHLDSHLSWPISVGLVGGLFLGLGIWRSRRTDPPPGEPVKASPPSAGTELYQSPPETVSHQS
jgi:hypothetical protein